MQHIINSLAGTEPLIGFLLVVTLTVVFSFIIRWIWNNVLIRLSGKTATTIDERMFHATAGPAQTLFIAAGYSFAWKLYATGIGERLQHLMGADTSFLIDVIGEFGFILFATGFIRMAWNALFAVIDWYEHDIASKTKTTFDEKIIPTVRKILKFTIVILAAMFISDHYKWPLSKLWAAAGIGSLAVALAAQDTFANIISGIIILIDRPFLVGDRIELTDGTFGDVIDIGLRSTKILSFDNTIFILPNADISSQRITNHAYPDFRIKVRHQIGVAYGTDTDMVKSILHEILADHPSVLNEPQWGIYFTEFGESSLDFLIIYWISDYKNKFSIRDDINKEINLRFNNAGIEIPFPQRDIHMRNT